MTVELIFFILKKTGAQNNTTYSLIGDPGRRFAQGNCQVFRDYSKSKLERLYGVAKLFWWLAMAYSRQKEWPILDIYMNTETNRADVY